MATPTMNDHDPMRLTDGSVAGTDSSNTHAQDVSQVRFEPLGIAGADDGVSTIDMLGDVTIQLCLELGRARVTVSEVLGMRVGSVVELDKVAGEPGDVYVNGTMIGRGEIVVVDDHFGIRIFEVVDPRSAQPRL